MNNNKKVLIVEDEKDIRNLLVFNLQKHNYEVDSTHDGEKALPLIRENKYDLILLDIMLPGINGFDLTRILKNDNSVSRIPIIMLTAKGEDEDIVRGLTIGADDYITKPFSIKVLIARIENVFRVGTEREIKTHKIEICGEIAYAVFTLNEIFSYKGNQNKDLSTYTCIFKNVNGTWKYSWMQRSQGTTDMTTWE